MGRSYDGTHRTTFLIDGEGIVQHVITKPNTKAHAAEILAAVAAV
jgi:peroxiredoxin Q/BCP